MNKINKKDLTPEQLTQLTERMGNLVQTIELKLTLSFNNLGYMTQPSIPVERIAEGVAEHLGFMWHVAATGSDKPLLKHEDHKPDCITQTHAMGPFMICDCGAYGEVGPPRDFWSLMSKFIKVEAVATKTEFVEYLPSGVHCSVCDTHDQWCPHVQPPAEKEEK